MMSLKNMSMAALFLRLLYMSIFQKNKKMNHLTVSFSDF